MGTPGDLDDSRKKQKWPQLAKRVGFRCFLEFFALKEATSSKENHGFCLGERMNSLCFCWCLLQLFEENESALQERNI